MAYLALNKGIVIDLGKANDRSLARMRDTVTKHPSF